MFLLRADPANPAEFLGACGLLEIVSIFTPDTRAEWTSDGLQVHQDISSFQRAARFLKQLKLENGDSSARDEATSPFWLSELETGWRLWLDWWLDPGDGGKSKWKMYGGQMTAYGTMEKLLDAVRALQDESLDGFLGALAQVQGTFGLDPRSGWSALDLGFSANDLRGDRKKIVAYPRAELCAAIAIQTFSMAFGAYRTWSTPLPLSLCRVAAAQPLPTVAGETFQFGRKSRGQGYFAVTRAERAQV